MKYFFYLGILLLNFSINQGLEIENFNNSFVYEDVNESDYEFDEIDESSEVLSTTPSIIETNRQHYNFEQPVFNLQELMKQDPLPEVDEDNEDSDNTLETECPTCECGIKTKQRIVGGTKTKTFEFPFQVALTYKKRFYCGSTLINDGYVLTAAHCTYGFKKMFMQCRFLVNNLDKSPKSFSRRVTKIWRPKGFNIKTFRHDLSILKLSSKVPITSTSLLRPVCLPMDRSSYGGQSATLIGWGRSGENKPISRVLKKARVPIFTYKQCRKTEVGGILRPDEICAGVGGRNVCLGDSGGPLLVYQYQRYVQIGIVSHGYGCALANTPAIFTKVSNYKRYIMEIASRDGCFCSG